MPPLESHNPSPVQPNTPISSPPDSPPQKSFTKKSLRYIFVIFGILLLASFFYRFTSVSDFSDDIRNFGYTAPSEVSSLADEIKLTDKARSIFYASRPALESRQKFNKHCQSHRYEVSILGCYTNDNIYIYNVDNAQLSGVIPSTAAHELLHAVWDRLSSSRRAQLEPLLQEAYQQHYDELSPSLKNYDSANLTDELHSRIGTQITPLPEELQHHYSQYFSDQELVVSFYNSYITPFNQIDAEMKVLTKEISTLKAEIEDLTASYQSHSASLSTEIEDFNTCARTPDCFTEADFNLKRNQLLSKRTSLDSIYDNLNQKIHAHNQKIELYNSNILKTKSLNAIINSNTPPDEPTNQNN